MDPSVRMSPVVAYTVQHQLRRAYLSVGADELNGTISEGMMSGRGNAPCYYVLGLVLQPSRHGVLHIVAALTE